LLMLDGGQSFTLQPFSVSNPIQSFKTRSLSRASMFSYPRGAIQPLSPIPLLQTSTPASSPSPAVLYLTNLHLFFQSVLVVAPAVGWWQSNAQRTHVCKASKVTARQLHRTTVHPLRYFGRDLSPSHLSWPPYESPPPRASTQTHSQAPQAALQVATVGCLLGERPHEPPVEAVR